jgi:ABC-type nickel/cobalt efflux system permease component RcnA
MEVQKMLIRFSQPMLLSGIIILGLQIKERLGVVQALFLFVGILLVCLISTWLISRYFTRRNSKKLQILPQHEHEDLNAQPTSEKTSVDVLQNHSSNDSRSLSDASSNSYEFSDVSDHSGIEIDDRLPSIFDSSESNRDEDADFDFSFYFDD